MTGPCPKCGFVQAEPAESCQRCGVIFNRIHREAPPQDQVVGGQNRPSPELLSEKPPIGDKSGFLIITTVKALFLLSLAVYGLRLGGQPIGSNASGESLLHLVNLPFHEAGHLFFTPLGRFIQILGGTLGQLIIPSIVIGTFLRQRQQYSAAVGLWWLGENFLDIAPYIDDARAGQLMLVGGVTGSEVEDYHDWEGILSRLGMMQYDHALARVSFAIGILIMLAAVCWGTWILWKEYRQLEYRAD